MALGIITIDGPAGSGKSTIAKELARRLGYHYLDTGGMYRAATLKAMEQGLDFADEEAAGRLVAESTFHLSEEPDGRMRIELDGRDVTRAVRAPEVAARVHIFAELKRVREEMVPKQRALARAAATVADGRDMGTVVFPDAPFKFFLDACGDVRARRRHQEHVERGDKLTYEQVLDEVRQRDERDRNRKVSPLRVADGAVVLDTTDMSPEAVVEEILGYLPKRKTTR
ncbi:MAG: (d)CMP kinase [Planctomycetes bacterium]|nr:(d)CMP kinase [Planctomycetota bacterium]